MSKAKQSLEENIEAIKASLPEEFHAGLDAMIAQAEDIPVPSAEEQQEAIKAELKANPDVDDAAVIPEFEANPTSFQAPPAPTAEEQEANMQAELKNWEQGS